MLNSLAGVTGNRCVQGLVALEPRLLLAGTTTAIAEGDWHDVSIWDNGVPDAQTRAIIGQGVTVNLNGGDHVAQEVVVQGVLNVPEASSDPSQFGEGRFSMYLNGDLVGAEGGTPLYQDWNAGALGGVASRTTTHTGDLFSQSGHFDGAIDTVVTYNRALEGHEVQELRNSPRWLHPQVADHDIAAYWHFWNGSVADNASSSSVADDLTLDGGAAASGNILLLDGVDDRALIDRSADINMGTFGAKSISLWFNANDTDGRQVIYEQGGGSHGINLYLDGDQLYAGKWNRSQLGSVGDRWIVADGVAANQWHHVTITLDGDAPDPAQDNTKTLTTRWVHVNSGGVFQIGTEQDRYDQNDFVLTLTGTDPQADHTVETAMGTMQINNNDGFLMAAGGGRLQFFGEEKLSFTKLGATAEIGATQIVVENVIERNFDGTTRADSDGALNWKVGDQIVIASSSYDYAAEDVRTIVAIDDIGDGQTQITLDSSLTYRHYGEIESYGQNIDPTSAAPSETRDIDLRAEVALLSRNVKIKGLDSQDTDSEFGDRANLILGPNEGNQQRAANGIGAHTMVMNTAGQVSVEGVQFDMGGQAGRLGRYPFHWHFGGDRTGDILRNASITNSNNRAVVVHGTDNAIVEGVVAHDVHGHGFFLESGIENGNQFLGNIAFGIHKVGSYANRFEPFVVDNHDTHVDGGDRFSTTAAFWTTNPDNVWDGNIVAGSEGSGWWVALHTDVTSTPPQALRDADPYLDQMYQRVSLDSSLGRFANNTVHSAITGLNNKGRTSGLVNAGEFGENMTFYGDVDPIHENFTVYKTHAGIYSLYPNIEFVLEGFRAADNKIAVWDSDPTTVESGLIVGHSRGNAESNNESYVEVLQLYHGRAILKDVHFAGFGSGSGPNTTYFFGVGVGNRHRPGAEAEGLTFENDGSYGRVDNRRGGAPGPFVLKTIYDRDGSLTGPMGGGAGYSLIPNDPFGVDASAGDIVPSSRWEFAVTQRRYANFQLHRRGGEPGKTPARITVTAPHGVSFTMGGTDAETAGQNNSFRDRSRFQASVDYQDYEIDFPRGFDFNTEVFRFNHILWGDDVAGAATVFKINGVANQMTPTVYATGEEINRASTLTEMRNASVTSYYKDGSDLWMKVVVTHEIGIHSDFIDMVPATVDQVYEAENFTAQSGTAISTSHPGYVGTGFVDYGNNSWIEWDNVNGGAGGSASLTFRYANGSNSTRNADVLVNGTQVGSLGFAPTGGWGVWETRTLSVTLNSGSNTVRLLAPAAGPNLDSLAVGVTASATLAPLVSSAVASFTFTENTVSSSLTTVLEDEEVAALI